MVRTPKNDHRISVPGKDAQRWVVRTRLGDYATRNVHFIDYLKDVSLQIENYINRDSARRPLNIFLAAPPGNGKSFLIKQLVKNLPDARKGTTFDEVYVASFDTIDELYGVFQRVQTVNLQGKVPVVFFDEVDSKVGNIFVYQKLLAPMWDGEYYIGKEKHTLGRCVFFFAGSTLSADAQSREIIEQARDVGNPFSYEEYFQKWYNMFLEYVSNDNNISNNKILDFIDRIDCVIRIPPIDELFLGSDIDMEYYDIIFMIIRKHFPNIKLVSMESVKWLCARMREGGSLRAIEKMVFSASSEDGEIFSVSGFTPRMRRLLSESANADKDEKYYELVIERE